MTPPNIFFRPILPKFEEIFEIVVGDFERWPMLPVRKTFTHMTTRPPSQADNIRSTYPPRLEQTETTSSSSCSWGYLLRAVRRLTLR